MMMRVACLLLATGLVVGLAATPVVASPLVITPEVGSPHVAFTSLSPVDGHSTPLLAGYWNDFVEHWMGQLKKQNGVVLFALGVGAVGLLIITRGKWVK